MILYNIESIYPYILSKIHIMIVGYIKMYTCINMESIKDSMAMYRSNTCLKHWPIIKYLDIDRCFPAYWDFVSYCILPSFLPLGLKGRRGIVVTSVHLSVRPSVRSSVCPSIRNALVTAITHQQFQVGSPNSHQLCILG